MNTRSNGAGVGERLSIVSAAEPRMMLTLWMSPAAVRFSVATLTQWGLMSREVTTPSSGTARASQAVEYLQAEVSKTDSGRRAPRRYKGYKSRLPPKSAELQDPLRTDRTREQVQEFSLGRGDGDLRQAIRLVVFLDLFKNFVLGEQERVVVSLVHCPNLL